MLHNHWTECVNVGRDFVKKLNVRGFLRLKQLEDLKHNVLPKNFRCRIQLVCCNPRDHKLI